MVYFEGITRKLVLPLIPLTAIGWLLVMIGFGIGGSKDIDDFYDYVAQTRNGSYPIIIRVWYGYWYHYWFVCISGPLTLVAAVVHAALWKPFSPFVGAATSFLSVVFLAGLGMTLYQSGSYMQLIKNFNKHLPPYKPHEDIPTYVKLDFAGAFLATLFWTLQMILQNFYDGFRAASEYQQIN